MKRIGIIAILILTVFSLSLFSQEAPVQENKGDELKILTSAQCEMCKERIEDAMKELEGIISANLDVDSKVLTVNYDATVLTPDDIRKAVTKVGYDADDMPASKKAYKKLPKCCQKDGHS